MINEHWFEIIVLVCFGLLLIFVAIGFSMLSERVKKLRDRVQKLEYSSDRTFENHKKHEELINAIDETNEKLKGSIDVLQTIHGKQIADLEERVQGLVTWNGEIIGYIHKVKYENEHARTAAASAEPYAVDPLMKNDPLITIVQHEESGNTVSTEDASASEAEPDEHEGVTYTWVFPTDEDVDTKPMIGQYYLVIGKVKGEKDLYSANATYMYSCLDFVMADGRKFDEVYAYVEVPSPSDVMDRVVDIALNRKGA